MYQSNRGRGQNRGRFRLDNAYRGCSRYNQDFRGRTRYSSNNRGSYGHNMRGDQRYKRNINNRRGNYRNRKYNRNRSRSFEIGEIIEAQVTVGPGQVLEQVQTEIELDVFECREYSHFARECLTRQLSRETEQIQKMFNMVEDQTILQTPLMETDKEQLTITLMEARDNLNL